jgi:hypothetical protein
MMVLERQQAIIESSVRKRSWLDGVRHGQDIGPPCDTQHVDSMRHTCPVGQMLSAPWLAREAALEEHTIKESKTSCQY